MRKLLLLLGIYLFLGIVLMSIVSASIAELEPQKINTNVTLPQFSDSATYQNISSIVLGNKTTIFLNVQMTKSGFDFSYILDSSYVTSLGKYCVNGYGDDIDDTTWQYCFDVTPSGNSEISQGEAIILLGSILIIVLLGALSLIGSLKAENLVPKVVFFFGGIILFFIGIIYNVSIVSEVLSNSTLIGGFETFYYIIATFMGLAVLGLIIFAFIVMIRAWKIKRGLIDR